MAFQTKLRTSLMILGIVAATASADVPHETYDAVVAGRKCGDFSQQLECEYRVGKSLRFSIGGIGMPDTAVTFYKVDYDGDYYATYGLLHGCVIVKPARKSGTKQSADFAFVSPLNGKVYRTWPECKAGM